MNRFYLPSDLWHTAQLDEASTHHAERVLRLTPGTIITVFDGKGRSAEATIEAFYKKKTALCLGPIEATPPPKNLLTLAQAIPKGNNMDLIIQKAVELGVTRIIPLITQRTIVRLHDEKESQKKHARWQSIALEACKQCGQNWLPIVEAPSTLQETLKKKEPHQLRLIASLEKNALPLKTFFASLPTPLDNTSVTIFIGPEGDFSAEEYALAYQAQSAPVSLGDIVLRTETAAFYCLSVLTYELRP